MKCFQEFLQGTNLLGQNSINFNTTGKKLINLTFYINFLSVFLFSMILRLSDEKTFGHQKNSEVQILSESLIVRKFKKLHVCAEQYLGN